MLDDVRFEIGEVFDSAKMFLGVNTIPTRQQVRKEISAYNPLLI
jgi:hypothetical protein